MRNRSMAALLTVTLVACCSSFGPPTNDTAIRSALNVLSDAAGAASKLASDGCAAQEALPVAEVRSGKLTSAQAEAQGTQIRGRCDDIQEAFAMVRHLHDEAADFVEAGKLDEAQNRINEAREQFRSVLQKLEKP